MMYWIWGLLPTNRGSNRDSSRRPLRSALPMAWLQAFALSLSDGHFVGNLSEICAWSKKLSEIKYIVE